METSTGQYQGGDNVQPPVCPICKDDIGTADCEYSVLTNKGCLGIQEACKKRGDNIVVFPGQKIHKSCRKTYTHPKIISQILAGPNGNSNTEVHTIPTLRSQLTFSFSTHCLFCTSPAKVSKSKRGQDVFPVRTVEFQQSILATCEERGDQWALEVRGRLEMINDLPAADAMYHQNCSVNFRTGRQVPQPFSPDHTKKARGRPSTQNESFQKIISSIEDGNDQFTLADISSKMRDMSGDDAFTPKHLKRRLLHHYGDNIIFSSENGRPDIITVKEALPQILSDFYARPKHQDPDEEKKVIIETAAKLIRTDIMAMDPKCDSYPLSSEISSQDKNLKYLPNSLLLLLEKITCTKSHLKVAAIGQSITQLTRPRSLLAPLQIGLGIQLHHQYGSKFLIEIINSLGFCSSYTEVTRFETSAAQQEGTDIHGYSDGQFIQYAADNVDHNICTLDGKDTFHGMGMIACSTPGTDDAGTHIKRLLTTSDDMKKAGNIDIRFYEPQSNAFGKMFFKELRELQHIDSLCRLDVIPSFLRSVQKQPSGWSGIMQDFLKGSYPGTTSVKFLPMIDMSASDPSCIYSTLLFICDHAKKYNVSPVVTFDQPLFWKASMIVENENQSSPLKSVILRLGAFHTQMSFLGCIGHVMTETGLQAALETVYAPNAVGHILSGKAVSRAVRAHQLMETALNSLLLSMCFDIESLTTNDLDITELPTDIDDCPDQERTFRASNSSHGVLEKMKKLFDQLINDDISSEDFLNHEHISMFECKTRQVKENLTANRTSKVWLLYMEMVAILKAFIRAERTGDWMLHLTTFRKMLPFLAACGHNLYARSGYLYLMKMDDLKEHHPDVFCRFMEGHHVLRRSDRYWAGLSSDLMIEQVLMRSLKTSGGLTRGRGMTESQRNKWLLAMPACCDVSNVMQSVTGTGYETSEQHKEMFESRRKKDGKDIKAIKEFFSDRSPFTGDGSLRNIETGQVAEKNVNVDAVQHIGEEIINSMPGMNIEDFTFKKRYQVITLGTKIGVKIEGDAVNVDPQLLFQRLVTAARLNMDDISDLFKYELSSVPSALFDSAGLLRQPNKPQLSDFIWKLGSCAAEEIISTTPVFVLDGGSLLQRIPWQKGDTFADICDRYTSFIKQRYSKAVVVFDGYSAGPSIKDVTHFRRSKGILSQRVLFNQDMPFKTKKELFLSNSENKQDFINLLSSKLSDSNIEIRHAESDADVLIVRTAVEHAMENEVVVVGEDTDLLVLLCYHARDDSKNIYFRSDRIRKMPKVWDIQKTISVLGSTVSEVLPVIHALTGCDTVSRLYGIGKGMALKRILRNEHMIRLAKVFLQTSVEKEALFMAGEELVVFLYGGIQHESLDLLRFRHFFQKTATASVCVQVQDLPPTSDATRYHVLRTYLQCQVWTENGSLLSPEEWGWHFGNNSLYPLRATLPPAPDYLLKVIRCNCQSGCETRRCSCRKHGLECSTVCGECRGINCANSTQSLDEDGTADDTDDI